MGLHIAFGMPVAGYLRNFESAIAALLRRGHRVTLVLEHRHSDSDPVVERLSQQTAFGIRIASPVASRWDRVGLRLRSVRDYWQYLDPRYDQAPRMKDRVHDLAPRRPLRLERASPKARALASTLVNHIERRLPVPRGYVEQLREIAPDVLLLTPLIYLESSQVQWLRAAARLRVPTGFCIHSWDNLTSKGVLHELPSAVFAWNDAQCEEAATLHGVPRSRCIVTGAPAFDHWFTMQPAMSRRGFLSSVGLPPEAPLIVYLCSSRFIASKEVVLVERWMRALRDSSDERLRSAAILIRPHPQNLAQWREWQCTDPAARVFPAKGENPVTDAARANYFHTLHYADAIVGLNTTALIEAAIFGKPVLSVAAPRKAKYRETLHVRYIEQGLLVAAPDFAVHAQHISAALAAAAPSARCRQFVERFVRPCGLECAAGDRVADAVERLSGRQLVRAAERL